MLTHLVTELPTLASSGLLDWVDSKNAQLMTTIRALTGTAAAGFVLVNAIKSGFAVARILITIIVGGVAFWGVWNITDIKDRTDSEVNSAPPPVIHPWAPTEHDTVGQRATWRGAVLVLTPTTSITPVRSPISTRGLAASVT